MNLTEEIKKEAVKLGADIVGIAPVERFKNAPLRMSPQGLLPDAKSVIVMGIHHLDAAVELSGYPTSQDNLGPYHTQSSAQNPKLDDLSFKMARFLEDKGVKALPITASNIWRYYGYKDLKVDFAPDLVHRYAAVAAGLGEIGWSGLFLNPEFGPRTRIVSVITDAQLTPDPMYSGEPLCDKCMECVKHCPTDCFRKEVKGMNNIEIGGKTFKFPDTNKWRCSWAENFALDLALKIPDKVDEKTALMYMEKYGQRGGEEGCCLKYCMSPSKRYYQKEYTDAPRRKKEIKKVSPKEILDKIKQIVKNNYLDIISVGSKNDFKNNEFVHPELHLPDAESIISIGITVLPDTKTDEEFQRIIRRRIDFTTFEITHYLDILGYSATTNTHIPNELVAQQLGIYSENVYYATILTSAKLQSFSYQIKAKKEKIKKIDVIKLCEKQGADMTGFFSNKRYEKFQKMQGKFCQIINTSL